MVKIARVELVIYYQLTFNYGQLDSTLDHMDFEEQIKDIVCKISKITVNNVSYKVKDICDIDQIEEDRVYALFDFICESESTLLHYTTQQGNPSMLYEDVLHPLDNGATCKITNLEYTLVGVSYH